MIDQRAGIYLKILRRLNFMSIKSCESPLLIIALCLSVWRSHQGPLYWHGLTLIPAWISNYIHYEVQDEITYPFPNFNGAVVEVWEWISNFIPHLTGLVITYPCWISHLTKMQIGRWNLIITWLLYNLKQIQCCNLGVLRVWFNVVCYITV